MDYFLYIDNLIYDINNKQISKKHEIYKVIEKYKIPPKLKNVKIYAKTIQEADDGLVFVGEFESGNLSFIYGINHIKKRMENKTNIFIKIYNILDEIKKYAYSISLNIFLSETFLIKLAILLLLNTYMRLGSWVFLKKNNTHGLLTLQKKHFKICKNFISLKFIGKKNVINKYIIKDEFLINILKNILNILSNEEYIFNDISEFKLNKELKKYDITAKDIRTFGVNYKFLEKIIKNKKRLNKKKINELLKKNAIEINHTSAISKKSYISDYIFELLCENFKFSTMDELVLAIYKKYQINNIY